MITMDEFDIGTIRRQAEDEEYHKECSEMESRKITQEEVEEWISRIWWDAQEDVEIKIKASRFGGLDDDDDTIVLIGDHSVELPDGEYHGVDDFNVNIDNIELIVDYKWGAISIWIYFDEIEEIRYCE